MKGQVVSYNKDKGYGFLKSTTTEESFFFHVSGFINKVNHEVAETLKGSYVFFDESENDHGLLATNISIIKQKKLYVPALFQVFVNDETPENVLSSLNYTSKSSLTYDLALKEIEEKAAEAGLNTIFNISTSYKNGITTINCNLGYRYNERKTIHAYRSKESEDLVNSNAKSSIINFSLKNIDKPSFIEKILQKAKLFMHELTSSFNTKHSKATFSQ